ncbi:TIGR00282 family metallophosphoesterase [Apilactobacillus timberlakei]|uniref:TIGR00282 family metallophosphoesterase n=1 Tax=Apilactobacillus timberlakei TaxID=2008380 RepID=A0ABY2YTJ1_9LACO|nr:TIGR00282 family metallophosphoesterase [Apilactobacillus timberlakei]TPR12687.1 TIGR00282 family metallophosphoesterase [Apilactobacillus timberlakei]TPR13516.1 TIGR00282 family metallophosphoesterase [Apilactobacillus timberlakei]TPR15589.1 TIGR00282 family metallophosphoesterase [Apilactobacillus timberlakei]
MKILFLGDVVGNIGTKMIKQYLPILKRDYKPQLTIVNGENATSFGRGINRKVYKGIMDAGADVITLGNHAWNNEEIFDFIDETKKLVRPLNFPGKDVPGNGYTIINVNGKKVAVINLQGRIFMDPIDDPFRMIDELVSKLHSQVDNIFVDFHAETTSEKQVMAMYLDGRISAMVGTHTHVQTNDNRVLKKGTAFMTDAGMCGPTDGVLGMKYENIIHRFLTQRPTRFEVEENGGGIVSGCIIDIDNHIMKAKSIKKILISPDHPYQG